jgi:hypothetical protein
MIDSERYGWASLIMLIPSLISLFFGIAINIQSWGIYDDILKNEFSDWSLGAIDDFKFMNDSSCPKDYELLSFSYLGTEDLCLEPSSKYSVGKCSGTSG